MFKNMERYSPQPNRFASFLRDYTPTTRGSGLRYLVVFPHLAQLDVEKVPIR
jgi:hypothetical protein